MPYNYGASYRAAVFAPVKKENIQLIVTKTATSLKIAEFLAQLLVASAASSLTSPFHLASLQRQNPPKSTLVKDSERLDCCGC